MEIDHVVERIQTVDGTILSKANFLWGVNHVVTGLSMHNVYELNRATSYSRLVFTQKHGI